MASCRQKEGDLAEEKADRDEAREVEERGDDLELPDETAKEVKGGQSIVSKGVPSKGVRDKTI